MATYTFFITEDGKLPEGMRNSLKQIFPAHAGKKIRMTIEEAKDKRSLDQNAYYWSAIIPHIRQVRADNGDPVSIAHAHEDLLTEFAPTVKGKTIGGIVRLRPMRSKEMNVEQMTNYITAITAAMANFGNPVPPKESE